MGIDYGERERQFLAALEADTGRDLASWMAAIAAEDLKHRNEIIDWLRRQGFNFSKASWLERIHNNSGQPIYSGREAKRMQTRPRPPVPRAPPVQPPAALPVEPPAPKLDASVLSEAVVTADPRPARPAQPVSVAPFSVAPVSVKPASADALGALLARAKAYRPLAQYLLAEIAKAVPGMVCLAREPNIEFVLESRTFATLAVSARELRLALALPGSPFETGLEPAKLSPGLPAGLTHMAVLTDARQVTPALITSIRQAATPP